MEVSNENSDLANNIDDIPIFTEKFLEHNKQRETELRNLKKMTTDCEENNAMLQKHIQDINGTINDLENEIILKKESNAKFYNHLKILYNLLYNEFQSVPIPGTNEYPENPENISDYIQKLQQNYKSNNNTKEMDTIKQKILTVLAKIQEPSKDEKRN